MSYKNYQEQGIHSIHMIDGREVILINDDYGLKYKTLRLYVEGKTGEFFAPGGFINRQDLEKKVREVLHSTS